MNIRNILNHKVVKAGSWYTITEFFSKGISFLTIPIFTRLLAPGDFGTVSLYTTWVGILTIFLGLNLNASITKGKYEFEKDYDSFVSSVMFLSLLMFMGYAAIIFIFKASLQRLVGFSSGLFYFMIFQAYFTFVTTSLTAKFRVEYNYRFISIVSIVVNILSVILSIVLIAFVFKDQPYRGRILGTGIPIIFLGSVYLVYMLSIGKDKRINIRYWKFALSFSIPLILSSLSSLINSQFDRIMIEKYIDNTATGLYSFAYNIGMIIAVLTYALDQTWAPWVYERMGKEDYTNIKSKAKIYRNFYMVAYAGLLFMSPEIIKLMAKETYWEATNIIPYIFAGYFFSYMYTLEVKTEFFNNKTKLVSVGTVLSAIINIILNMVFIPRYGYIAAAVTTTISYFFLFIFHYIITSKVLKKNIFGFKFHINSILYMLSVTICFIVFREMFIIRLFAMLLIVTVFINKYMKRVPSK